MIPAGEGGGIAILKYTYSNLFLIRPTVKETVLPAKKKKMSKIGFYQNLPNLGEEKTYLKLPLAFLSHLSGKNNREAFAKITAQEKRNTKRLRLNSRTMEYFPPLTPYYHISRLLYYNRGIQLKELHTTDLM